MQNINEELKRMLYLTQHMRGVVISEQNTPGDLTGVQGREKSNVNLKTNAPSWNGGNSGQLDVSNFSTNETGILINAADVGYKDDVYNLAISRDIGKDLPYTIVKTTQPIVKEPKVKSYYEFIEDTFPYPDNIITPQVLKGQYGESKKLLSLIAEDIVSRLKNGQDIKITMQGFADSAAPTEKSPTGYNIEEDHKKAVDCEVKGKLFCGITETSKRNLWLANNRAKRMAFFLNSFVKNMDSGKDISNLITFLEPVSSYDPNNSKNNKSRIGKKSVTINITATSTEETPGETIPGKIEVITRVPEEKLGYIDFDGVKINVIKTAGSGGYVRIIAENTKEVTNLIGNKIPDLSKPGKLNGKSTVSCEIKNDSQVIVDGLNWGTMEDIKDYGGSYANIWFATQPSKICLVGSYDNILELSTYCVILHRR
jgi:hypothetical protein